MRIELEVRLNESPLIEGGFVISISRIIDGELPEINRLFTVLKSVLDFRRYQVRIRMGGVRFDQSSPAGKALFRLG